MDLGSFIRFLNECPGTAFGIFLILWTAAGNLPFANIARNKGKE